MTRCCKLLKFFNVLFYVILYQLFVIVLYNLEAYIEWWKFKKRQSVWIVFKDNKLTTIVDEVTMKPLKKWTFWTL